MVNPVRGALLLAFALLAVAAAIYGASFVSNVVIGSEGLDGPCVLEGDAQEGSTLRTSASYWPPRTECAVRSRSGELTHIEVHEWPWVPGAVIALAAVSLAVLAAGVARSRMA